MGNANTFHKPSREPRVARASRRVWFKLGGKWGWMGALSQGSGGLMFRLVVLQGAGPAFSVPDPRPGLRSHLMARSVCPSNYAPDTGGGGTRPPERVRGDRRGPGQRGAPGTHLFCIMFMITQSDG